MSRNHKVLSTVVCFLILLGLQSSQAPIPIFPKTTYNRGVNYEQSAKINNAVFIQKDMPQSEISTVIESSCGKAGTVSAVAVLFAILAAFFDGGITLATAIILVVKAWVTGWASCEIVEKIS